MTFQFVDIFDGPGRNFHADRCLDLAAQHAARGIVWELLPFTIHGPGYQRAIHWELTGAFNCLKADNIHGAHSHLREAARCVPVTWRTVHRPADPSTDLPQPSGPLAGTRQQTAPGHVEAAVYGRAPATTLVRCLIYGVDTSICDGPPTQDTPPAAGARTAWLDLRAAADAGTCGAIVVSDPRQIRPRQPLGDHRWARAAREVAAAACPGVWAAVRLRPGAIAILLDAPPPATAALHQQVVAAAAAQLRRPAGHQRPPDAPGRSPAARPMPGPPQHPTPHPPRSQR